MESFGNKYGYNFQIKLLTCLATNELFFKQIIDSLRIEYFDSKSDQFLYSFIKIYYNKYEKLPTKDIYEVEINKLQNDILKTSVEEHFKDVFNYIGSTDLPAIQDEVLSFCSRQAFTDALDESIKLLEANQQDKILPTIEKAALVGKEVYSPTDYIEDFDKRYEEEDRHPILTGWDVIDDLMDGGLSGGELGVLVGGPGGGKSWSLISIAANALRNGIPVHHYTLELSKSYTQKRYDAFFSGINVRELKYNKDKVKEIIKQQVKAELNVEWYPSNTFTINQLKANIDRAILAKKKPGLIIIDYGDLMKGDNRYIKQELRHELRNIYIDLRSVSGIYQIPIWTASQAGRSASKTEIIQGDQVAEDYSKIMTADFVVSLQRLVEHKLGGTGRWHIIKNRFGPDGLTFPSKIDTNVGHMQIFNENSVEGKKTKISMQNSDDILRKTLKLKLDNKKNNLTKFGD